MRTNQVTSDSDRVGPAKKRQAVIPLRPSPTDDLSAAVSAAAESLVSLWLRAADRASERVSPSQLRALIAISRHDGINLSRLASELGAIPSSATRLCDRLVAAGLMHREPSPRNKREVRLFLSPEGRGLLDQIAANRQADLAGVLSRMPPADRESLCHALESFARAAADPGVGRAHQGC